MREGRKSLCAMVGHDGRLGRSRGGCRCRVVKEETAREKAEAMDAKDVKKVRGVARLSEERPRIQLDEEVEELHKDGPTQRCRRIIR